MPVLHFAERQHGMVSVTTAMPTYVAVGQSSPLHQAVTSQQTGSLRCLRPPGDTRDNRLCLWKRKSDLCDLRRRAGGESNRGLSEILVTAGAARSPLMRAGKMSRLVFLRIAM